ncbi:type II toxin-antitoxin system HicB family antitoxin [bacterium]|nr:type II toxin-antitoxin system HicB family antitoxin [bacterium]
MRQVLLYQDESGGWIAECPSLPGCNTQGDSFEEAVSNIRDAISQYVASLQADGEPVPEDNFSARVVAV